MNGSINTLANPAAPAAGIAHAYTSPRAAGAFSRGRDPAAHRLFSLLASLLLIAALSTNTAVANESFPELRVATAIGGKYDVDIVTAAWYIDAPRWTRAQRLEFAVGAIQNSSTSQIFGFIGPVWLLTDEDRDTFVEVSIGPTALSGSTFGGRELGGNVQFRSALTLGREFGRRRLFRIALRLEHISNGGLRDDNPGLDSIGLSFSSTGR